MRETSYWFSCFLLKNCFNVSLVSFTRKISANRWIYGASFKQAAKSAHSFGTQSDKDKYILKKSECFKNVTVDSLTKYGDQRWFLPIIHSERPQSNMQKGINMPTTIVLAHWNAYLVQGWKERVNRMSMWIENKWTWKLLFKRSFDHLLV